IGGNAAGAQVLEDHLDLAFAANHADITGPRFGQVIKRLLVMGMAAGDDEGVGGRRQRLLQLAKLVADIAYHAPPRRSKARRGAELIQQLAFFAEKITTSKRHFILADDDGFRATPAFVNQLAKGAKVFGRARTR